MKKWAKSLSPQAFTLFAILFFAAIGTSFKIAYDLGGFLAMGVLSLVFGIYSYFSGKNDNTCAD